MQEPAASNWTQVFSQLPAEGLIAAACGLAVGLSLWAFGSRVLKPAFVTAGMALGAVVGLVLAYALGLPFPAWVAGLAGAMGFAGLAFLAYKPAMGLCMAVLFGSACPLGVIAYAEHKGHHLISAAEGSEGDQAADDIASNIQDTLDTMREADNQMDDLESWREWRDRWALEARTLLETTPSDLDQDEASGDEAERPVWLDKFDAVIEQIRAEAVLRWNAADPGVRRSIVLSSASGAIFGLLVGLGFTTLSAAFVTSMGGSALALASAWSLIASMGQGAQPWMPSGATIWLVMWMLLAAAGLAIQWTLRRKPADTPR